MFAEDAQTLPRDALRRLQAERLVAQVARLYERVPFYRARWDAAGVRPEDIRGLDDLARLPFTSKLDMREVFPYGLLAVDRDDVVEVHMSSGTTGKPVVDAYTHRDMALWADVMARTLDMAGVGPHDVVQNAFGYGLFTGGFGIHYGAEHLGALVLPMSSGNTRRQLETMTDFGTTVLTCTPSYALFLAEYAAEHGVDLASSPLRAGFFGAEPWSLEMRADTQGKTSLEGFALRRVQRMTGFVFHNVIPRE